MEQMLQQMENSWVFGHQYYLSLKYHHLQKNKIMNKKIVVLFINVCSFCICLSSCLNSNSRYNQDSISKLSDSILSLNDTINKELHKASETRICIPDSIIFLLKNIKETINNEDIFTIERLKKLNKKQIEAWINPIPNIYEYTFEYVINYKAVALQKITNEYYLLLLMQCEDATNQQYIVSIDKQGKYIDALAVSYGTTLSNSDVEFDEDRGIYISGTSVKSFFEGDNIRVMLLSVVSNLPPHSHEETDYWEELDEIIYLVKADGHIVVLEPRKKIADKK